MTRILEDVAAGVTYGAVCRRLNAERIPTKRGGTWTTRTVRELSQNEVYLGCGGYPRVVDDDLFERAQAARRRVDPIALRARKGGGRRPSQEYLLRGIAFCSACWAPMYVRE